MEIENVNATAFNTSREMLNTTITNATESDEKLSVGAENIYPALVECFGIISLGYLAGR